MDNLSIFPIDELKARQMELKKSKEKRIILGAIAVSQFTRTTHRKYIPDIIEGMEEITQELEREGYIRTILSKFYEVTPRGFDKLRELDKQLFGDNSEVLEGVDKWVDDLK